MLRTVRTHEPPAPPAAPVAPLAVAAPHYAGGAVCATCHDAGARVVARLRSRSGDAGGERHVGARQLQRREVQVRRHHVDVLATRRQIHRQHRRPGRTAARLRNRLHVRRAPAAAIPDRLPQRPQAGAVDRVGLATEGAGRSALVPSIPQRQREGGRLAALDQLQPELELHVRRVPLDGSEEELRSVFGYVQDDLGRDQRIVRSLPRPRLQPRCMGAQGRRVADVRLRQRSRRCARRTPRHQLDACGRNRQLATQRAATGPPARSTRARVVTHAAAV